jgi:hypothetical protein
MNSAAAKRPTAEKADNEAQTKGGSAVHVRLDERDSERLNALAKELHDKPTSIAREALSIGLIAIARIEKLSAKAPAISRLGLAQEALSLGLDAIARDPALLLRALQQALRGPANE